MDSSAPTTAMGMIGHAGPHGDLDEAAPAEAAEPVAVGVGLGGGLGALGEDQGQLLLVVEDPVGVVGVGGHAAGAGPQGARPPGWCGRSSRPGRRPGRPISVSMPCMMAGASDGMAPAWLAISRAPPSVGIFSRPSHSTRNQ